MRSALNDISADKLHFFHEQGYLILRQFAPMHLVDSMKSVTLRDVAASLEPVEFEVDVQYPGSPDSLDAPGGKTIRRLRQAMSRGPAFQEWASHPPLVELLQQLLGTPITCPLAHHNCVMTKHPRYSSETGWHRDFRFWDFQSSELVNAWLALGRETVENGCLQVIPGTHKLKLAPERLDEKRFLNRSHPENQSLFDQIKMVELEPGDVLLFHAQTFHAATRNFSDQTKYSVVFTFHGPENSPLPGSKSASFPELVLPVV